MITAGFFGGGVRVDLSSEECWRRESGTEWSLLAVDTTTTATSGLLAIALVFISAAW